ncbi:MAG: glycosyltransferase family A protein [Pseudomonadota bacterium]
MTCKYSIIIPTYNRELLLCRAVESIFKNSSTDVEVIVVNDGSADSYENFLKEFSHKINYVHLDASLGVSAARNVGIQSSESNWVVFLDDDDYLAEDFFVNLDRCIEDKPDIDVFWSDVSVLKKSIAGTLMLDAICFPGSSAGADHLKKAFLTIGISYGVCMRRKVFSRVGCFDTAFNVGEDLDLFIRILDNGLSISPTAKMGVFKDELREDRLSCHYARYSEGQIYERLFLKHKLFFESNPSLYNDLLGWSLQIHVKHGNMTSIAETLLNY